MHRMIYLPHNIVSEQKNPLMILRGFYLHKALCESSVAYTFPRQRVCYTHSLHSAEYTYIYMSPAKWIRQAEWIKIANIHF